MTFPATGGSTNVLVTSAVPYSGVTVSVTSGGSWLSAAMPYGEPYTGYSLNLSASANVTNGVLTQPRNATIQVNNEVYTVTQQGTAPLQVTITGQVYCSCDRSPIANASVAIGNNSTTSSGDGSYSITTSLSPATYPITANGVYYSTATNSITISSGSPAPSDFTLTPNGTDPALVNAIVPQESITVYKNEDFVPSLGQILPLGVIYALFTPKQNLTLKQAACRLGYDHFNWINYAKGYAYYGRFNCDYVGERFFDPPQNLCDNTSNPLPNSNPSESSPFANPYMADPWIYYWNEGDGFNGSGNPYNLSANEENGFTLEFQDQPEVPSGDFITALVGVPADHSPDCEYFRHFHWQTTYNNGTQVVTLLASLLETTNGTGGITMLQTNLQPSDLPSDVFVSLSKAIGGFPVTIQPPLQSVVSGGSVTFAIFPTNSSSPLNYQWRKNGTNISSATNLTLQLPNVTTNDAANYDAILSDTNGSLGSVPATLTVLNAPLFQSPAVTTNGFVLSWVAAQGKNYQLQYKTNLNQVNWINLGSTITASNTVLSATNATGSDKQRFFRIQQQ